MENVIAAAQAIYTDEQRMLLENFRKMAEAEFAPLADDELVSQALAAVLGVREQPGQSLSASLIEYLHHRELLLLYTHPQQARLFVAGANRYLGD